MIKGMLLLDRNLINYVTAVCDRYDDKMDCNDSYLGTYIHSIILEGYNFCYVM